MSVLQAILLGAVQGVTEFFPVSSSGHLTLVSNLMGIEGNISFMFTIMLHIGTLLAVVAVFYKIFCVCSQSWSAWLPIWRQI